MLCAGKSSPFFAPRPTLSSKQGPSGLSNLSSFFCLFVLFCFVLNKIESSLPYSYSSAQLEGALCLPLLVLPSTSFRQVTFFILFFFLNDMGPRLVYGGSGWEDLGGNWEFEKKNAMQPPE